MTPTDHLWHTVKCWTLIGRSLHGRLVTEAKAIQSRLVVGDVGEPLELEIAQDFRVCPFALLWRWAVDLAGLAHHGLQGCIGSSTEYSRGLILGCLRSSRSSR